MCREFISENSRHLQKYSKEAWSVLYMRGQLTLITQQQERGRLKQRAMQLQRRQHVFGRPGIESHQRLLEEICMEDASREVPSRRSPQAQLGAGLSVVRLQLESWDSSSSVPGIVEALQRWSCPAGFAFCLLKTSPVHADTDFAPPRSPGRQPFPPSCRTT